MLDLQALEKALSSIEKIGQDEMTFKAGDHNITIRILTPDEEIEVQRYTRDTLTQAQEQEDQTAMMEFLDRFKVGVLSHAIIAVDNLDMREEDTIATGEKLDNGVAVRIPRYQAIRNLITSWTRPLQIAMFQQYGKLLERVEKRAEQSINWEPSDLDAEIERLKGRIRDLEATKAQTSRENPVKTQVDAINEFEQSRRDQARAAERRMTRPGTGANPAEAAAMVSEEEPPRSPAGAESTATTQPDPDPEPHRSKGSEAAPPRNSNSTHRRSAIPQKASAPPQRAPEPEPEPEEPAEDEHNPFDEIMDSMPDFSDEDALAAEARRLAQMRAAAAGGGDERRVAEARAAALQRSHDARREAGSVVRASRRRAPPHRHAANMDDAVVDTSPNQMRAARPPAGIPEGVPVFRADPQNLADRPAAPPSAGGPKTPVVLDEAPANSLNPKFAGKLPTPPQATKKRRR